MNVFVTAAELGSFAGAAATLGVSPQMVAKHIRFLETHLGVRLLNRTTRRQSLTEVGVLYLERCKLVLAELDLADSIALEANAQPRGRLKINAPVSFGTQSLIPTVTRYLQRYSDVTIDLTLADRYVDLVEEGYEAVFRIGPLADSRLIARPLAPFQLVACASPVYLRKRGAPVLPTDLSGHECLGFANWVASAPSIWHFVRNEQTYDVLIRSQLRVNSAAALLNAALESFGIILVAEDLVRGALSSGKLVAVLPGFQTPSREMHLLYLADRQRTPKLRSFIEIVLTDFGL